MADFGGRALGIRGHFSTRKTLNYSREDGGMERQPAAEKHLERSAELTCYFFTNVSINATFPADFKFIFDVYLRLTERR